jgi:hypothetical protein
MLINIELPHGNTVKVESDWYHSLSDYQLEIFFQNQSVNFEYHQILVDPFDNSVIELNPYTPTNDDFEDIDESIDYQGDEY